MSKNSMTQDVRCPNCNKLFKVNIEERELTNSKFTCTECGHVFDLKLKIVLDRDKKLIDAMESKLNDFINNAEKGKIKTSKSTIKKVRDAIKKSNSS